jgi:hypothetical protein
MTDYSKNEKIKQFPAASGRDGQGDELAIAEGGPREGGFLRRSPLSTTHIRPRIEYVAGASLIKSTKDRKCEQKGGGKRSKIKGFSKQSRHRLMEKIGSIRRDAELPNFVTLTYPNEFPTVAKAKRDLKVFLQRLERQFPMAGGIWKLEPQDRGAPHYHMMVWGVDTDVLFRWTLDTWYEIAGGGDRNHYYFHAGLLKDSRRCVERVRSFRGVWSYASKYLGKTFEVAEWGSQWTGRFWGTFKPENIPFGETMEIEANQGQVAHFMRYQRRFMHMRTGRDLNSLKTFCDADQWIHKIIFPSDPPHSSSHPPGRASVSELTGVQPVSLGD